jgi:hypothetical protein
MKNIDMKITGTGKAQKLVITVDLSKTFGMSKSGNSEIIATSSGNVTVPGTDAKLGLNVYKPI